MFSFLLYSAMAVACREIIAETEPRMQQSREEVRKVTVFDVIKQLELDVFCDVMYGVVKDFKTQDELKGRLQEEISEKALRQINDAALMEGYPLIQKSIIPQNRDK